MKSFLIGVLWRAAIGIGISLCGIIVSAVTGNWNIEYWWFGGLGIAMIIAAALPFFGGMSSSTGTAWVRPDKFNDEYRNTRGSVSGVANWSISAFIIGIINLIVPVWMYNIHP